jgi:hypothetical protein
METLDLEDATLVATINFTVDPNEMNNPPMAFNLA